MDAASLGFKSACARRQTLCAKTARTSPSLPPNPHNIYEEFMYKFTKLNLDPKNLKEEHIASFLSILKLVCLHRHALFDDFVQKPPVEHVLEIIEQYFPYFWVVETKESGEFAGFIYLYDLIGDKTLIHSATVATCFAKPFWGKPCRHVGRMFLAYCRDKLGIKKLKAECFSSNRYVTTFLRNLNFKKEGVLKNETIVLNRPEDLILWAIELSDQTVENIKKPANRAFRHKKKGTN